MLSSEEKKRIMHRVGTDIQCFGYSNFKASPTKLAYVYAFEMSNHIVKIGISNNVRARMQSLKSSSGLTVINYYQTELGPRGFMLSVERRCKKTFSINCIQGEYFDITFAEACTELDRYAEEISTALKVADEKFLDEIAYLEELKIVCEKEQSNAVASNAELMEKVDCMLICAELTNLDSLRNKILREVIFMLTGKKMV